MASDNDQRTVLYMNLEILDVSEAVKEKVAEKVQERNIRGPIRRHFAEKALPEIASQVVTPKIVAQKMAEKLCVHIPQKMEEKGITAVVEKVFLQEAYLVCQLQVQRVDSAIVAESTTPWISALLQNFFASIGLKLKSKFEDDLLPQVVQRKLEHSMEELLTEKMEEKKVVVDAKVLTEAKQARYFYAKLKYLETRKA